MTPLVDLVLTLRRLILAIADRLAWAGPTLARWTVGWIFVLSGWGKLHDLDRVIQYFGELRIPHPELQAPFAAGTELVCGALVLVGLFTRVASVPLIVTMTVAILTAQKENVASVGDLFGLIEWCYVALLVWLGVAGPGPLSLDALLVRLGTPVRASRRGVAPSGVALASRGH
jgi:putative oxidoreductase